MSPEQKARFLERMFVDFDKMDIPEEKKSNLKYAARDLWDKMEQADCWDPTTQAYLDGLDKIDEMLKNKKSGKVCLLHDCEICPDE